MNTKNPLTVGMRVSYVPHGTNTDETGVITLTKTVVTLVEGNKEETRSVEFSAYVEWPDNTADNDWYLDYQLNVIES